MKNEYVYYCPMRPPELGSIPKTDLLYVECFRERKYVPDAGREVWGWAVYKKRLTPDIIAAYELIEKTDGGLTGALQHFQIWPVGCVAGFYHCFRCDIWPQGGGYVLCSKRDLCIVRGAGIRGGGQ